jgi:hypothetical protein
MATNSFIQVPPDGAGKKLFAQSHTIDGSSQVVQAYHLADPDIPTQLQRVSYSGAATVGFSEGEASLDSFGNLRVSNATVLGYYDYVSDPQDDLFWDRTTGTSAITHVADSSYLNLSVGSASGDSATRSTTRYHFYQPGIGNLVIQTLALNDNGKTGNTRRWGYGDEKDAMFWELDGEWNNVLMNHFFVVIRSNVGGVVTENRIPRINWNGDKIDGNGPSGFTLALTGRMFYWIDYAWLGVGPVRFGVLGSRGERITCHTFEHPAGAPVPYTTTGSLPLFWQNINTASTSGPSEMRSICSAIYAESAVDYNFWRFEDIESPPKTVTTDTPILSMRPELTLSGKPNRTGIYPECLQFIVTGGNVKVSIVENATTLTGATWTVGGGGCTEGDIGATAIAGGSKFKSFYLAPGCHTIKIYDLYETNDEGYHVYGDGLSAQTFSLVATKFDGTTVTVGASLSYRELR